MHQVEIGNASAYVLSEAFDHTGNLWIAEANGSVGAYSGQLIEYTPAQLAAGGTRSPVTTITTGRAADALAFDASGNLWVSISVPGSSNMPAHN